MFACSAALGVARPHPSALQPGEALPKQVELQRHFLGDIDKDAVDVTGEAASYFFRAATEPLPRTTN